MIGAGQVLRIKLIILSSAWIVSPGLLTHMIAVESIRVYFRLLTHMVTTEDFRIFLTSIPGVSKLLVEKIQILILLHLLVSPVDYLSQL